MYVKYGFVIMYEVDFLDVVMIDLIVFVFVCFLFIIDDDVIFGCVFVWVLGFCGFEVIYVVNVDEVCVLIWCY